MKTLLINQSQLLELASELAHNRAADYLFNDELITNEDDMFIENDGTLIYTDRAQDEFNRCYDYYLTIINSILK
jgi:hypothetical protein